jgi:hypothetical protein
MAVVLVPSPLQTGRLKDSWFMRPEKARTASASLMCGSPRKQPNSSARNSHRTCKRQASPPSRRSTQLTPSCRRESRGRCSLRHDEPANRRASSFDSSPLVARRFQ